MKDKKKQKNENSLTEAFKKGEINIKPNMPGAEVYEKKNFAYAILSNLHPDTINPDSGEFKLRKGLIDVGVNPYTGHPTALGSDSCTMYEIASRTIGESNASEFVSIDPGMDYLHILERRNALRTQFALYANGIFSDLFNLANARMTESLYERIDSKTLVNIIIPTLSYGYTTSMYNEYNDSKLANGQIALFFDIAHLLSYRLGEFNSKYEVSTVYRRNTFETDPKFASLLDIMTYWYCSFETMCMMLLPIFTMNFNKVKDLFSNNSSFADVYDIIMEVYNYEQNLLLTACENTIHTLYYEALKYSEHGFPGIELRKECECDKE